MLLHSWQPYLTTVGIHIMARTNQLSKEKWQSIITLRTEGQSVWENAKTLKVSPSAVMKTIKHYDETSSRGPPQEKNSPLPRFTSAAEDKFIWITSFRNRKLRVGVSRFSKSLIWLNFRFHDQGSIWFSIFITFHYFFKAQVAMPFLDYTFKQYLQLIGNLNKITCYLVSAELANGGFFVDNVNFVIINHWKSQILPHLWLRWKRSGLKFCRWVSSICSCHCCKSGIAPFRNRAVCA